MDAPSVYSVRSKFLFRDLWANSSYLMLPPKRSLRSWIILSNGEASKLDEEGDEEKEEDIFFYDKLDNRSEITLKSNFLCLAS